MAQWCPIAGHRVNCCNQAITLKFPVAGKMSEMGMLRQQSTEVV